MAKVFRVWSEDGRVAGPVTSGEAQGNLRAEFADGRYELQSCLGGGHGTEVYRAMDLLLRRPVALKVYRAGAGPQAESLFKEEAQRLAWLEHGNLVTLYDAGIDAGRPFLVLQYVDGVTLASRLSQGALSLDQTIAVAGRLADVLAYVHERGIIHRDVRPGSVLVDERDVYLSDFGISRTLGGLAPSHSGYLAPEQLQRRPVGPAADVYALGLLLLECLTGEQQYPGGALATAVARLTRPPVIPDGLPEPLRDALEAMTAEHPAARPSAEECRAAFALCAPDVQVHEYADEVAPEPAGNNVYEFDAARRRRNGQAGTSERHDFGAGAHRPDAVAPEDDDTQPLSLVDLTAMVADEECGQHRHRAGPGRRRRWLLLAATGAAGMALAGGIAAVGAPRATAIRGVAAPPQAAPEVAVPPEGQQQGLAQQVVPGVSEPPSVRSSSSSAVRPAQRVPRAREEQVADRSPAPTPTPRPTPTPCVARPLGNTLGLVVAGPGTVIVGGGAAGAATPDPGATEPPATPTPTPSATPTPGAGPSVEPTPDPPCAA